MHPPHAASVLDLFKEGDIACLQNVRVKQARSGYELEGNMWKDRLHPNKILVSRASSSDQRVQDLQRRKVELFMHSKEPNTKTSKTRRKRQAKKAKDREAQRQAEALKRKRDTPTPSDDGSESEAAVHQVKRHNIATSPIKSLPRFKANKNIRILYPDQRLSTFSSIPNNPHRTCRTQEGLEFELTFVNCKHAAYLRVVDFYPHDIRDFCIRTKDEKWTWSFWLVVVAGDPNETLLDKNGKEQAITIHVFGREAQFLLGDLQPENLYDERASPAVTYLQQTLFKLWADLQEQKEEYLSTHPDVKPDSAFSARAAGIKASSLPFLACVQELGLSRVQGRGTMSDDEKLERDLRDPGMGFVRSWRLFGTEILTR